MWPREDAHPYLPVLARKDKQKMGTRAANSNAQVPFRHDATNGRRAGVCQEIRGFLNAFAMHRVGARQVMRWKPWTYHIGRQDSNHTDPGVPTSVLPGHMPRVQTTHAVGRNGVNDAWESPIIECTGSTGSHAVIRRIAPIRGMA